MAYKTKFQSQALETWTYLPKYELNFFGPANPWNTPALNRLTDDCETSV